MRLSCNGCRVLRKGCSDDCTIRTCLQWIKSPDAQANATLFLAKFYGRAGLLNLLNAGPDHLRPAVFRSLLYEACGRLVNPVYGSVGLLWTGSWHHCQAAVEAVLRGEPVAQLPADAAVAPPQLQSCDIRHVAKDDLHKVAKGRTRFKRATPKAERRPAASHQSGSTLSGETEAASHVSQAEPESRAEEREVEVELTLGLEPACCRASASKEQAVLDPDTCRLEFTLL